MELKKEIVDEKTGITYTLKGDYYIPNIVISKDTNYTIGRYGAWTYNSIEDNMIMSKDLVERLKGEIINEE